MITSFYTRELKMKKELMIFAGIFLFLAIGMHFKEWTSHPIEHLKAIYYLCYSTEYCTSFQKIAGLCR